MPRGNPKIIMSVSVEPKLVKQLDATKGEDVPRSRFVERVLNGYLEGRHKEKVHDTLSVGSSRVSSTDKHKSSFFVVEE
jgi:metal-responsive CopG/Arc/MetJ family transcriptional regulator